MKKTLPFVLVGVFVASALAMPRARAYQDGVDARVRDLEARVSELAHENEKTSERLEQVIGYLEKQAAGGRTLIERVDQSESLGFTAGINYRSREVLLEGWRAYHAGQQEGLPKRAKAPGEPEPDR